MDDERRLSGSACFLCSEDASAELWHSTPVKKKNEDAPLDLLKASGPTSLRMDASAKQRTKGSNPIPGDTGYSPSFQETEFPVSDLSSSTLQKQRREIQLLMAEVKDRELELNAMSASHMKEYHAWEQDRKRVLSLGQRCSRLDEELQKRNEMIKILTKRLWIVEMREKKVQKELGEAQQQLCELEKKRQHMSEKSQECEEKNQSLSSTVMALSTQVGSLQVREEELSSMLKLKDKDVTEASRLIHDLSGRLRELETTLKESRSQEEKLQRDVEEIKRCYKEARHDASQLRVELQQQVTESSTQREEIIRLKQELQLLHRDLILTGEGDSWKDELLELARSKQDRLMSELQCLRQVCETQRNDLQLLQLNQESALKEKTGQGVLGSQGGLTCHCLGHRSPSTLREKNFRPPHPDPSSRPAADQKGSDNDGADSPLSSSSVQQLLDATDPALKAASENSNLRFISSTMGCITSEPRHFHERPTTHHQPAGQ